MSDLSKSVNAPQRVQNGGDLLSEPIGGKRGDIYKLVSAYLRMLKTKICKLYCAICNTSYVTYMQVRTYMNDMSVGFADLESSSWISA